MNRHCRFSRHRRGTSIGVIMMIVMVIGILVASIGLTNTQTLWNVAHSTYVEQSFHAAQAGLRYSVVEMKSETAAMWDGNGRHTCTGALLAHPDWTYQVTFTDNRNGAHPVGADGSVVPIGHIHVRAIGTTPRGGSVTVGAIMRRISLFRYAVFVSDHLAVTGGAVQIDGSVATSRVSPLPAPVPIALPSLSTVTGRFVLPAGVADAASLISAGGATADEIAARVDVSGVGVPLPTITAPTGLALWPYPTSDIKKKTELQGGHYYPNPLVVNSVDLTLHGGIYHFQSDVTFKGNSRILLHRDVTVDNPVRIYIDGSWNGGGCSIVANTLDPRCFQLYGTETSPAITLGGTADNGLLVYQRGGQLTLQGTGHLYGSFVGRAVEMNGTGAITYNPDASDVVLEPPAYELVSWTRQ